jgi:O-antigen ligase
MAPRDIMHTHQNKDRAKPALRFAHCIHGGLYLILLTPLLTWSGFLMPQVTAKVLGFQILVELVSAAALISVFLETPHRDKRSNLFLSPLFAVLALFLVYSLLSAIFGVDLNRSLWGFIDRQDGLVLLLHFFAWAALVAWFFRREASDGAKANSFLPGLGGIRSYLCFSFGVSVVAALMALGESEVKFDGIFHPIWEVISSPPPMGLGGVFGNPMALDPYLMFHFFWGIYLFQAVMKCRERAPLWRSLLRYAALIAIGISEALILMVIMAGQRGVLLGMLVSIFVCTVLVVFGRATGRWVKAGAAALIVCCVAVSFLAWHYRDSGLVRQIPILQRLTHISAAENRSTTERLLSWRSALKGFWDHPLMGWGYDNVYYALNRYYDPRHVEASPFLQDTRETWFDKSHNFFIDLLVERGIIGIMAYLVFLGVIARSLWRMADRHLALCLAGGLVAYVCSNMVAFDNFGSLFGFFLTSACIVLLGDATPLARLQFLLNRDRNVSRSRKKQPLPARRRPALKMLAVLALLAAGLYLQAEIAIANHRCLQAQTAFAQDPAAGISLYTDAFDHFSPYDAREKLNCAYLIVNSVINKRSASQSLEAGMLIMRLTSEALAAHPQDVAFYMVLNDLYNGLALYVNREFAGQAEAFGRRALELSPARQEAMYHLSRTYVIRNESARAVELSRRMLQDADFPIGHWYLGLSLLQDKQYDEAKKEITKAIAMGYRLNAADTKTLKSLLGEKDYSELTGGR